MRRRPVITGIPGVSFLLTAAIVAACDDDSSPWDEGGRLWRNGGVSLSCSYLCSYVSPVRLKLPDCRDWRLDSGSWSLRWRIPPSDRVFTDWRSRKRRGTFPRDTRCCGRLAPEPTGQCGEFTRGGATRPRVYWGESAAVFCTAKWKGSGPFGLILYNYNKIL